MFIIVSYLADHVDKKKFVHIVNIKFRAYAYRADTCNITRLHDLPALPMGSINYLNYRVF